MAGRPRMMLRRIEKLRRIAEQLSVRICHTKPAQYTGREPVVEDPIQTAWDRVLEYGFELYDWLDELHELYTARYPGEVSEVRPVARAEQNEQVGSATSSGGQR